MKNTPEKNQDRKIHDQVEHLVRLKLVVLQILGAFLNVPDANQK
jgi:hypothetical protein